MKILSILLAVLFATNPLQLFSQLKKQDSYPPFVIKSSQYIEFNSAINHHDYTVSIMLPGSYTDSSTKKFPVIYVLDGQWSFTPELGFLGGLNYDGLVPEVITVAIGWKDQFESNRTRDFTPTKTQNQLETGGAPKFLEMVKNEIIPFVKENYRVNPSMMVLSGGSYGGLFALYALFKEPGLFNHYIIGSPSVDYDDMLLFKMEKQFAATHKTLPSRIFFHWGKYESDFDPGHLFYSFFMQMKNSGYNGLVMDTVSVDKMAHASNGPYGEGLGLQFVFARPDLKLTPKLLDEYAGLYEQEVHLTHEGDALFLNLPGLKAKMMAENENRFYVPGLPGIGFFTRNDKGKVASYSVIIYGQTMTAKRLGDK